MAHYTIVAARRWAASSIDARGRLTAKHDCLKQEIELFREELRIKDARTARIPPRHRLHYRPSERMAILELKVARGWSLARTPARSSSSPRRSPPGSSESTKPGSLVWFSSGNPSASSRASSATSSSASRSSALRWAERSLLKFLPSPRDDECVGKGGAEPWRGGSGAGRSSHRVATGGTSLRDGAPLRCGWDDFRLMPNRLRVCSFTRNHIQLQNTPNIVRRRRWRLVR